MISLRLISWCVLSHKQDDDAINAETYIKKASFLVNSCKDEALNLQYKVSYTHNIQSGQSSH